MLIQAISVQLIKWFAHQKSNVEELPFNELNSNVNLNSAEKVLKSEDCHFGLLPVVMGPGQKFPT